MLDEKKLVRTAQLLLVDFRKGSGSPPSYPSGWSPLWGAKVERIEINHGAAPSVATIWFPEHRWNEEIDCGIGDNIRIRTDAGTCLFMGFITALLPSFSGGTESSPAFERNAFVALSYRWLLETTSPIYAMLARGIDDYENGVPVSNEATWLTGHRAIFNPKGRPNRDASPLINFAGIDYEFSIFADIEFAETASVKYWTAKDMLKYILSPCYNAIGDYWPIADDFNLEGGMADSIDHEDWDRVLNNISVQGLNVIEAVALLCRHLGWSFREDYSLGETPYLIFYKIGDHSQGWTVAHEIYAPAPGDSVAPAATKGRKLLWSAEFAKDISAVINWPIGLGMPHRFEITCELVPGWLDADLVPDTSQENANLFFTESDLQNLTDKNSKDYFKYYHPRGLNFRRDVGRRWVLNESGRYTNPETYNRGPVFNFAAIIPDEYILDENFDPPKRRFAPFKRQLLNCLTFDKDSLNSVGIVVEFCFNGDAAPADRIWQAIPASISSLQDECGIYIDEANLAELVDIAEGTIKKEEGEEGALEGIQLNYWASLCDDKLNERPWVDEEAEEGEDKCKWKTRVRVTTSVQLDRRLLATSAPSSASGSPFLHSQVYDFSEKYGLLKRTTSSKFTSSDPPMSAYELDNTDYFGRHLDAIRRANDDKSVSGQFTMERLWLGNKANPQPEFTVGDCISKIAGREYDFSANIGAEGSETKIYPEIIQIIYSYEQQKQKLITRDLRFAEVLL